MFLAHVLFWGHWYPCFGFLVTSPLGFKARVGSVLFAFAEVNVMYVPEIYLWCYTCQPLDGQHCSQSRHLHWVGCLFVDLWFLVLVAEDGQNVSNLKRNYSCNIGEPCVIMNTVKLTIGNRLRNKICYIHSDIC